jgi:hypothetical protein
MVYPKTFDMTIHAWTMQGTYLRAVVRGDVRRNLGDSEAGFPDAAAWQEAQVILDERAARRTTRAQRDQDRRCTAVS